MPDLVLNLFVFEANRDLASYLVDRWCVSRCTVQLFEGGGYIYLKIIEKMVEYSRNRCNYPQVPTERILKNFKQLSHKNDSISQMASWLSFYRSSEETLCYLFSEAFVDSTLNKEERLAIFYVFHELVTRSITVDEESRRFFMAGYEQFLLSAAPIIGRLDLKSKSYYLQVVRLWQQSTKFPQEVCERLRLLFNSGSGEF